MIDKEQPCLAIPGREMDEDAGERGKKNALEIELKKLGNDRRKRRR